MHPTDERQDTLEIRCRNAVDYLIERNGWRLLDPDDFTRRTAAHLSGGVASDPLRAATYTYCEAMYHACSGVEGRERQEAAYTELFRYLYDSAYQRYREVCAEVAQDAIERVFASFGSCRVPGAFLAFAFQQLRSAARTLFRAEKQPAASLGAPLAGSEATLGETLPDQRQRAPVEAVLDNERRARLDESVASFRKRHPRARQQLDALLLKYVEGLDDETISERLGKPIESIYVLRARAKKKLASDPEWRALAVDLGIEVEEE